jgi:hypothetical protein
MERIKREMDGTKKALIGVAAFILCIFFFMLPLIQYTQDSSIAPTGWKIASSKSIPVSSGINESNTVIEIEQGDEALEISSGTDELVTAIEIEQGDEVLDVSSDINELDTTSNENIPIKNDINFLVFALLIVPIVVIILTFTKVSFTVLRNVYLIGITVKIAFIIVVYARYGDYFIPTIFSWIILAIYIGLSAFSHYGSRNGARVKSPV